MQAPKLKAVADLVPGAAAIVEEDSSEDEANDKHEEDDGEPLAKVTRPLFNL